MPTQRPYFSNFFAAFRTHHALKSTSTTSSATSSSTTGFPQSNNFSSNSNQQQSAPSQVSHTQPTATRPIPSKTTSGIAGAAAAFSPPSTQHHTHTRHASNVHGSRTPTSPLSSGAGGTFPGRARRGSDSSNEGGFRDALGGEKWFIGGRTATGEEKFYNLTMVRRDRSAERLSLDRMSL